jgi:hypothetical protein
MKPYNVEVFQPDFEMVGNTNVNEVTYKEDYLSLDENTITVLAMQGVEKQDFIRISRGDEEYAGVITGIGYGTDKSKQLQTISYKPLAELLNTSILFDVDAQGQGTMEEFICDRIRETFIENTDALQNISGLTVSTTSETTDWDLHITPSESGGHYNIVNLMDSVIVPALQKYGILVKAQLNAQDRQINVSVGIAGNGVVTIEADLPNITKKSVTIKQVSADVNKLVLYDTADYTTTRTYYLHSDLSYDTNDQDRITPVVCELQAVQHEEDSDFEAAAIRAAHDKFSSLAYSNLIELTMENGDGLVKPDKLEFGQEVEIISDGVSYRSILTGRERGKNTKLIFGTVRLDLTKILRRSGNGQ